MSFPSSALVFLVVAGAFVLAACGNSEYGGTLGGEPALTAELVVPPAEQEAVSKATATVASTATSEPETIEEETDRVNVPNRVYNVMGDADAPITMFDFSDFL